MVTAQWPSGPAASVSVARPAFAGSPCPVCAARWPELASVVRRP